MYGPNGRFLHGAFHRFFRDDLLEFLKRYGVETKVERGGRIFPVSDDAADVVRAFRRYLKEHGATVRTGVAVKGVAVREGIVEGVRTEEGLLPARAVVLATGGATWPATGSTGDGYRMSAALGHAVTKLRPALVPLVAMEVERAKAMQGVSLKNVRLTAFRCPAEEIDPALAPAEDVGRGLEQRRRKGPVIESRMGEMIFTHFGIGGPITLLMSLSVVDALAEGPVGVMIDLKPALTAAELRARLQRDFDSFGKRGFRSLLAGLLPHKMIEPFIEMTGIPADRPGHQISAAEREKLLGSAQGPALQHPGTPADDLGDRYGRRRGAQGDRPKDDGVAPGSGSFLLRGGDGHRRRHGGLQPPGRLLYRLCGGRRGGTYGFLMIL